MPDAAVVIHDPYAVPGGWLRGNLHAHSTTSDGLEAPDEVFLAYARQGYDFLALTEHDLYEPLADRHGLVRISGAEVSLDLGRHALILSAGDALDGLLGPDLLDRSSAEHELRIACHPNRTIHRPAQGGTPRPNWLRSELEAETHLDGIEIYNHLARCHYPDGYALDHWDHLLTMGRWPCWGFAHDDTHNIGDPAAPNHAAFGGWVVVRCAERTPAAIVAALKGGAFYASSGVAIRDVGARGGSMHVELGEPCRIRFVAAGGAVVQESYGTAACYAVQGGERYLRMACAADDGRHAWTQPFRITRRQMEQVQA
jgi:hypothetical protein